MLEFLGLLLAFVLALNPASISSVSSEEIITMLEGKISEVSAPEGSALEQLEELPQGNASQENSDNEPQILNTERVATFNSQSENLIGEVPQVAQDNAPPLIPATEAPTPTPSPTPTPPVITPIPDPEPIPDPFPGPCYPQPGNPKPLTWCPLDF